MEATRIVPFAILLSACGGSLSGGSGSDVQAQGSAGRTTLRSLVGIAQGNGGRHGLDDHQSFFGDVLGLGINKVRVDFTWSIIEKQPGQYAFGKLKSFMDDAASAHVDVLPILDYGNPIYYAHPCPNNDDKCIPDAFTKGDFSSFRNYALATARAFGSVDKFEVWNEANNATSGFWLEYQCTGSAGRGGGCTYGWSFKNDPKLFAALSADTASALRMANPARQVAAGGPVYMWEVTNGIQGGQSGPDFMTDAFSGTTLAKNVDANAFHAYESYPPRHAPESSGHVTYTTDAVAANEVSLSDKIATMNGIFQKAGGSGPSWITEIGWANKNGVSYERQARWLVRSVLISALDGVSLVYLYNMYDASPNSDTSEVQVKVEDWFGLIDSAGNKKQAYGALKMLFGTLGDYWVTGRVTAGLPSYIWELTLQNAGGTHAWVLWNQDEEGDATGGDMFVGSPYPWQAPSNVRVFQMDGGSTYYTKGSTINVGQNPIYVVEAQPLPPPGPSDVIVGCNGAGGAMVTSGPTIISDNGVTLYCDDGAGAGEWQCDQLANRFMSSLNLPPVDNWVEDLACEICDLVTADATLSSLYTIYGPGYTDPTGHKPEANDLLIWWEPGGGCNRPNKAFPGHVAVVTGADDRSISYVQQNWMLSESINGSLYAALARSSAAWDAGKSFFGQPGGLGGNNFAPKCWVHPRCPPHTSCNPGPSHNPCAGVSHDNNGLYCGSPGANGYQAGFHPAGTISDPNIVYECIDGQIANETRCTNGCYVADNGAPDGCISDDPCSGVPGKDSGWYCGAADPAHHHGFNREGRATKNFLYHCVSGQQVATDTRNCGDNGCDVSADPNPDECKVVASDPCLHVPSYANGTYCGTSTDNGFAGDPTQPSATLYTCLDGVTVRTADCVTPCVYDPNGADHCSPDNDPCTGVASSGDGTYCASGMTGQSGFNKNGWARTGWLYTCRGGRTIQDDDCGGRGCIVESAGKPDMCHP